MPSQLRMQKIADRIREDLSKLLIFEVDDPRLSGVMVTDVNVDRELYYANIYVSAIEGKERSAEILAGLESASNFLRHQLSQSVELRTFPRLRFYWDPTPENADRVEFLLKTDTKRTQRTRRIRFAGLLKWKGLIELRSEEFKTRISHFFSHKLLYPILKQFNKEINCRFPSYFRNKIERGSVFERMLNYEHNSR